ncbi:amidohydrolase/deacetylase family metallohydrolase [Sinomicrobium weinanense]|uniref:Amidohydrolase/deacetylase family metallohydrolase n=1 Tax=Sinomicrobium weinanense TaxID=2842200 RepID=A0A926Q483_9FLAO|nr:amidohydrolase/deacetylase family metallohydrolase [Sinomicrobium weinanense]MBC9796811.1 amidohydrolase/deacetylase family metallohydrolase [Sinomicrobium weinanense]MBU3123685.1 amidohydrolase/deacetylase family metallohydrolase [Sinomicrobium weinanense]
MQKRKITLSLIICILFPLCHAIAQKYDLLLQGGTVIDPKNKIHEKVMDIAIANDTIVAISDHLDPGDARKVISVKGLYVTPGLIDLHSHHFFGTEEDHYLCNGFYAVQPDAFTFRSGVTTVVDAGSPGWKSFEKFKKQTIDHSKTRVLAFLNIVGEGMRGGVWEQDLRDMNAKMTAMTIAQHPELVGIKVAHYSGAEWAPIERAVAAGKLTNTPVMIDFGGHEPPLSLTRLLLEELRPGDIFTHMYANLADVRMTLINPETGELYDYATKARARGIVFDVGHGGGSFEFSQAVPAVKKGFFPDAISTDLHTESMNAGMKDLLNVMSKFLNLGMPLPDVIKASSWKPAQVIHREELGSLSKGSAADIAVLSVLKGDFGFVDSAGNKMKGTQKLQCEMTLRAGKVVYDLNGLSSPLWNTAGAR